MKKLFSLLMATFSITAFAQDFGGYLSSNYAGVNGIDLQPASIVDNRYKLDILLLGANVSFQNNFFQLKKGFLNGNISDPAYQSDYVGFSKIAEPKSLAMSTQILGPSFMFTINEKHSVAFTSKIRMMMNIDNVSSELLQAMYTGYDNYQLWGKSLLQKGFNIQTMAWAEYGLSYGREIYKTKHHYFKGGVRLKMLQGLAAAHFYSSALNVTVETDTSISLQGDKFSYGHSSTLDNFSGSTLNPFASGNPLGIGGDIGFVYEWRPGSDKYSYEMDGKQNPSRDENKYKLKIGASLLDLGAITFQRGSFSKDFIPVASHWKATEIPSSAKQLDSIINQTFVTLPTNPNYTVNLPTVFSLQIDYHIWKTFYINATLYQAYKFDNLSTKVHEISSYSIAPRWDYKWFGIYVPISYNDLGMSKIGVGAMIGPFFLGTSNVGPLLYEAQSSGLDFYAGVKVSSLHFKKNDSDGDKVSDHIDRCIDDKGLWANKGCPDTDGDSITDKDDACPKIPGLRQFKGCPDTDKDGIEDQKDDCPTVFGPKEFNGCPDRDGDKIIDVKDSCPDEKGILLYHGCADNDNDSIVNKLDSCPNLAGPRLHHGCPDTDADGTYDHQDSCATVAGPKENHGCPYGDEDHDGVLDKDDECPKTAGPASNKGCPELKKEEEEILNTAFQNLEFETSKAVIKAESFASLDELAALLVKKNTWKLRAAGHTDNVGDAKKNLKLSQDRTEAVAKYLASKGVAITRIIVEYYGASKPIADNKTPEGKQRNRRVEMSVVFE